MVKLQFERLEPVKLPLLQRFYKQHYPSTKPKKTELIIIARREGQLCAAVRFRPIEHYQLLTGMAVDETMRSNGIGHQLLAYCQEQILDSRVYCFAFPWLKDFYQTHGFKTIDSENLPNSLKILLKRYQNGGKSLIPMHYQQEITHI